MAFIGFEDTKENLGNPSMVVGNTEIPFMFDGRKMYFNLRKPTDKEIRTMVPVILTSPKQYNPKPETYLHKVRRKKTNKILSKIPIEEWRDRLALAPDDVIRKTLQATIYLANNIEDDNRQVMKRHYQSRFPFLN